MKHVGAELDRLPRMEFLSENYCPNSGPDSLFGTACSEGALTIFGYCGQCWAWADSRIPAEWVARVDESLLVMRGGTA